MGSSASHPRPDIQRRITGRRWKIYRPFVEDDGASSHRSPSPRPRMGYDTPITEEHNRMADYIPSTGQFLVAGQNGVSRSAGINMFWEPTTPRRPHLESSRQRQTVLRLGLASITIRPGTGCAGLWQNPPNSASPMYSRLLFPRLRLRNFLLRHPARCDSRELLHFRRLLALPTPQNVASFVGTYAYEPRNIQPGRVHQSNANVERELPGNVLLTAGYAGSVGGHLLLVGNDLNTSSPGLQNHPAYTLGCFLERSLYLSYTPPTSTRSCLRRRGRQLITRCR